MPTTIITGRDLSLTIDGDDYDAQASSVTLATEIQRERYEVLDGPVYKTLDTASTLTIEMLADWGAAGSVCEALWSAADTAPDTTLPFTFDVNGGSFTGNAFPAFPDAGGTAPDALTVTVELTVDGAVTYTPAP